MNYNYNNIWDTTGDNGIGPAEAAHTAGFIAVVPVIPPGASLAANSSIPPEACGKIPGRRDADGSWTGLKGWQDNRPSASEVRQYDDWGSNVGLVCGEQVIAVDADIVDERLADAFKAEFEKFVKDDLGYDEPLPWRTGLHPKRLAVLRVLGDRPIRSRDLGGTGPDGQRQVVQILGSNKQFVAVGIHLKTGKPYQWSIDIFDREFGGIDALPGVTPQQVERIQELIAAFFEKNGFTNITSARDRAHEGVADAAEDPEWVKKLVEEMPNPDAIFSDRRSYIEMALAIRGALAVHEDKSDHFDLGLDLFLGWASRWDGGINDPEQAERDYRGARRPHRLGFNYLANKAADCSVDVATVLGFSPAALDFLMSAEELAAIPSEGLTGRAADIHAMKCIAPTALQSVLDTWKVADDPRAAKLEDVLSSPAPEPVRADKPQGPWIISCADWRKGFVAPRYLIDGILQRGRLVTLTGHPSAGKTAVAWLMAFSVAEGMPFGRRSVRKGRVLFLAGENPDDGRARYIASLTQYGIEDDTALGIDVVSDVFDIEKWRNVLFRQIDEMGPYDLVIVDTLAAFFPGEDENSNTELGNFARELRKLTMMKGNPCVLVLAHPAKSASRDGLKPRGGSAFFGEIDANLTLWKDSDSGHAILHHDKIRGQAFEEMAIEFMTVTSPGVVDEDGKRIPSVVAQTLSDQEWKRATRSAESDQREVLTFLNKAPGTSMRKTAVELGWYQEGGEEDQIPALRRVQRTIEVLRTQKLVEKMRSGSYRVSKDGKEKLEADREAVRAQMKREFAEADATLAGPTAPDPFAD